MIDKSTSILAGFGIQKAIAPDGTRRQTSRGEWYIKQGGKWIYEKKKGNASNGESVDKESVANTIYNMLGNEPGCRYEPDGPFICHAAVGAVKENKELQKQSWFKDLKFHEWNELKWDEVGKKLVKDKKVFSNEPIDNMVEDIGDGSMNGHSFISYKGKFIDPYLKSMDVEDNKIQEFDKYFLSIM